MDIFVNYNGMDFFDSKVNNDLTKEKQIFSKETENLKSPVYETFHFEVNSYMAVNV